MKHETENLETEGMGEKARPEEMTDPCDGMMHRMLMTAPGDIEVVLLRGMMDHSIGNTREEMTVGLELGNIPVAEGPIEEAGWRVRVSARGEHFDGWTLFE